MIQQINLYQDVLKTSRTKPTINSYIFGSVTALIFFLAFSIYLFLEVNTTKNNLQNAKQQLLEAETQVQVLKIKYPEQQINPILAQEVSRLQNILHSLSRVIHLLTDKKSDQTQGFSRYFSALSRQSISDVWLRNIAIEGGKQILTLEGSTFIAEKIPLFIQNLHNESVFQGKKFAKLIMTQDEETENQINFTISTTTEIFERENHD